MPLISSPWVYLWRSAVIESTGQAIKAIAPSSPLFQHTSHKYLPIKTLLLILCQIHPGNFQGNQSRPQSPSKHCWWFPPLTIKPTFDIVSSSSTSHGIFTVILPHLIIFPVWGTLMCLFTSEKEWESFHQSCCFLFLLLSSPSPPHPLFFDLNRIHTQWWLNCWKGT